MSKELVISANPHETRVAILEEGQLCEYYVEREKEFALVGSIYKGRVTRVLPGMQSAFVEIGLDSDAFLYVSDFLEDIEEFDHIVTTVEEKVQKMADQGGQIFPAGSAAPMIEPADVESAPVPSAEGALSAATGEIDLHQNFHPAAPVAAQPPVAAPAQSPSHGHGPNHGRFDNRAGRGGRGDFGRRGNGGRHGGRGGRGGDRRFGRELPSSKYASPHLPAEESSDSAPAEGHIRIILPGESLAKYKGKVPSAGSETANAQPIEATTVEATPSVAETPASSEPIHDSHHQDVGPASAPRDFRASSSAGLEPLPGESLAKWKTQKSSQSDAPPKHLEPSIRPIETHDETRYAAPGSPASAELDELDDSHESRGIEFDPAERASNELSLDEAASVAEHIAEAQVEEQAREARASEFAASESEESGEAEVAEQEDFANAGNENETLLADVEAGPETDSEAVLDHEDAENALAPSENDARAGVDAMTDASQAESGEPGDSGNPPAQQSQPWKARVQNDFRSRMQHPARKGRDRGRRDDRGRRPQHGPHHGHTGGHHRTQPRRTQLIADMLKQGQEIIVQIAKEPLGKKGARITSHIALPGRYLVYMPTLDHTGVSRKIASAEDRARLRQLVNEAKGAAGGGFIVRTAAASAAPEDVRTDVEFLTRTWSEIKARSEQRKAPSLLHRDLNLVERILRDYLTTDFTAIWVDVEEEYTKVVDFVSRFQPQLVNRVKLYTKETPVFEEFGIQQEIDKGLRPKVWLKSGGYIVINHTEALVAIDVNTGKFVGKGSNRLEDTIVRTNLEACKEIVRQMRLRDLGGIIVIDFIDMEERRNREKVMAALEDALRADRAPSKVLRFNEFGLVAITRKRTKQALERTLCQPCPYCTGSGMVKSVPTLCYEIQTEARKMAPELDSGSLTLRVHPEISKALKTRESSLIEELERWTKKSVIIQADPTLHWEQYDIY
ncbi:MAG: Rne/Rng family ribonuclease [Candidatus Acidiferrales bacterium]